VNTGSCTIAIRDPRLQGFTLIELVLVIVLLSILAVSAWPRFANLSIDAYRASVASTGASLQEALVLARATHVVKGYGGAVANLPGFGDGTVDMNAFGWPVDTAGSTTSTMSNAKCQNIWNGILQNPPTTTTTTSTAFDYGVQFSNAGGNPRCIYTFRRDTTATRSLTYSVNTGRVVLVNP
jgi:MSHA pilin protein MshB